MTFLYYLLVQSDDHKRDCAEGLKIEKSKNQNRRRVILTSSESKEIQRCVISRTNSNQHKIMKVGIIEILLMAMAMFSGTNGQRVKVS